MALGLGKPGEPRRSPDSVEIGILPPALEDLHRTRLRRTPRPRHLLDQVMLCAEQGVRLLTQARPDVRIQALRVVAATLCRTEGLDLLII